MQNLRFTVMTIFLFTTTMAAAAGGHWPWVAFLQAMLVMTVGDELLGNSRKLLRGLNPFFLNALLFATLPFLALLSLLMATFISSGDPFGLISLLRWLAGIDLAGIREATTWFDLIGAVLVLGLLYGAGGINVAHELFHRVHSPLSVATGRWLLAFSWDTTFAIEHVYGHHIHVATLEDPASARRGEYLGRFLFRSTIGQVKKAFQHETRRLSRKGQAEWSWHNRALRGQLMSLVISALFFYAAGWLGVAVHLFLAVIGKGFLESINYIEHYGLVRVPGQRVGPRHSWDCYKILSNAALYHLPRHSAHHENAAKKFWELEAKHLEAPQMPYGYMTMILLAFVPPLWHRTIDPLIKDWDERFANQDERDLIASLGW